jgi:dipeptidyl aminopeptidase/acylaminoacyl peptidase
MTRLIRHCALLLCVLLAMSALADTTEFTAAEILVLGPLPAVPAALDGDLDARVHATRTTVPELDPQGWLPAAGDRWRTPAGPLLVWTREAVGSDGFVPRDEGVWWLAARLLSDRWERVTVTATDGAEIWVDGALSDGEVALTAGVCFVYVRVVVGPDRATVALQATVPAASNAQLAWDLEPRLDFSRFDRARLLATPSALTVAPRGDLVAWHLDRRHQRGEGRTGETTVLDGQGRPVAADLGGPGARPVAFSPDGRHLLLRRSGKEGADLLLWSAPRGPLRTVVRDELDLGLVRFDPDGRRLLLASSRGLTASDPDPARRRWDALRERVTDWSPRPHLHLVDLQTGLRQVLTAPGDWTLDDAAWLPGGERIVYARTVPQTPRPWFRTEIRVLDPGRGEDRLVATFSGGWEVRPQALAPHPDGRRVAFLGPPDEVTAGRGEHNVYNLQLWLVDLQTGDYERISRDQRYAFAAGRGLPAWIDGGRKLLTPANAGGRDGLVALASGRDGWRAEVLPTAGTTGEQWSLGPDGEAVAYTAGGLDEPRSLWLQALGGKPRQLAAPDADLGRRFELAVAADATYTGPGGETIEAWWYRPIGPAGAFFDQPAARNPHRVPLIVYYYGGCCPTTRGFNPTHQFWAAAGYAVLVINPRGTHGYGDAFADWHAGDWGPVAAADVIAGTEALLARHGQLDPARVGCYGGSYGGFLTMYLVAHGDRFAAAVAMYGIADLATYWGQGVWGWTYGDMAAGGRTPWTHPEYFAAHSPLYAAGQIQTPLLLLHGDQDSNVTPGESHAMFTALQVQGKPVELVTFAGEDHGIAGTWENYVAHRTMMREWFDRWLLGQPEAWRQRWTR